MALINLSNTLESFPVVAGGAGANSNTTNQGLYYDDVAGTLVLVNNNTGETINSNVGPTKLPITKAALRATDLNGAAYTDLPVGTNFAVVNWNGSAKGVNIIKVSIANSTSADWMVLATEDSTKTAHIGQAPADL